MHRTSLRLAAGLALLAGLALASPQDPHAPQDPNPTAQPERPSARTVLERLGERLVGGEWHAGEGAPKRAFHVFTWSEGRAGLTLHTRDLEQLGRPPGTHLFYALPGETEVRAVGAGAEGSFVEGRVTLQGDELRMPFTWVTGERQFEFVDRWVFDGPDRYRWTLLQRRGDELAELTGCTFTRRHESTALPAALDPDPSEPAELAPLAFLTEHAWDGLALLFGERELRTCNTYAFEHGKRQLVSEAFRVDAEGGRERLERTYTFHDPLTDQLRLVGFTTDGGTITGTLHPEPAGLRFELTVHADPVNHFRERLRLAEDGSLHARLWVLPEEGELDEAEDPPLLTATYTPVR